MRARRQTPQAADGERLVREASRGDEGAVDALLERHLPGLRAFIRLHAGKLVRARESCSDLVQSVCREVLQDLGSFDYRGEAAFRHWLYTLAKRKILDRARYYRAAKRDAALEHDPTGEAQLLDCYLTFCTPSHFAMAKEGIAAIEAAFDALPAHYRDVVVMSRLVGLSHGEIAERLGRTREDVATLLYRALSRLSHLIDRTPPRRGTRGRSSGGAR